MTSTWSTPSLRIHIAAVAATAMLLVFGVGGWAATAQLSGAVIAAGTLVVDTNVKKVQHPSGGVVGEVRVRDGQKVELGEVLVRLDETHTRANLTIIVNSLDELAARQARLEAERDGVQFVLRLSRRSFPFIAKAFADMGFAGDGPANATAITVQIVRKPPDQVGFAVHPRRWVVERFFAWISRNRRLWKDPEATLASARAFLYAASVMLLVRRLARHPLVPSGSS